MKHYVYALMSANCIIYIGRTESPEQREASHRYAGKTFETLVVLEEHDSKDAASIRERALIKLHKPALNIIAGGVHQEGAMHPHSLRLGSHGEKLNKLCRRLGLRCADITKLALEQLFATYPKDKDVAMAVYAFRANEAKRA